MQLDLFNTKEALNEFVKLVMNEAKKNLDTGGEYGSYNASGNLKKSINYTLVETKTGFKSEIKTAEYGEYLDKGVSGIKKKYKTPYAFKSKGGKRGLKGMPPTSKLDKWSVRRKIAPRDDKGRFLPRQSVLFLIAAGIFRKGIAPTLWLTNAMKKHRKQLPVRLTAGFKEDVGNILKVTLKSLE